MNLNYATVKIKTILLFISVFQFTNLKAQTYCTPSYSSGTGSGDYISLVEIPGTTLSNISGASSSPYFTLFSASGSSTATLMRGNANPYGLKVKGGTTPNCYIAAWGDWNKNGAFEMSEFIGVSPNAGNSATVSFTNGIKIPDNAVLGTTRIRFRSSNQSPGPLYWQSCNSIISNVGEGEDYIVTISCQFSTPPTVGFTYVDTLFAKSPSLLFNANTYYMESNKWYINGSFKKDTHDLVHTFSSPGNYTVCLKSKNCNGSDSACYPVTVYNPTQAPIASFKADKDTLESWQTLSLTDLSTKGPVYWYWTVTPSAGVHFINGTSRNSQHPQLSFINKGSYQVCLWDSNALGRSSTICKSIYVDCNSYLCFFPFESNSTSANLFDEGGASGSYTTFGTCTFLIDACASSVNLKFSQFNLSANSYLRIYDGKNNQASPLFSGSGFTGTAIPGGSTGLIAASGKMYIEFQKGTPAPGFAASWTTVPSSEPLPSGKIIGPDTVEDCGALSLWAYKSSNPGFNPDDAIFT